MNSVDFVRSVRSVRNYLLQGVKRASWGFCKILCTFLNDFIQVIFCKNLPPPRTPPLKKKNNPLEKDLIRPKKTPPRMRSYDSCTDCMASAAREDGKLWCEKYEFYTDENGLCDGYLD